MAENIYVGNLKFNTSKAKLKTIFSKFGEVTNVNIIHDSKTGLAKGYAFITILSGSKEAIKALDKTQFGNRTIRVSPGKES